MRVRRREEGSGFYHPFTAADLDSWKFPEFLPSDQHKEKAAPKGTTFLKNIRVIESHHTTSSVPHRVNIVSKNEEEGWESHSDSAWREHLECM